MAIEVKASDTSVSKHLHYFSAKLDIPYCYQVIGEKGVDFAQNGIRVTSVENLLGALI